MTHTDEGLQACAHSILQVGMMCGIADMAVKSFGRACPISHFATRICQLDLCLVYVYCS